MTLTRKLGQTGLTRLYSLVVLCVQAYKSLCELWIVPPCSLADPESEFSECWKFFCICTTWGVGHFVLKSVLCRTRKKSVGVFIGMSSLLLDPPVTLLQADSIWSAYLKSSASHMS